MSPLEAVKLITAATPTGPLPDMPIDPELITAGQPIARGAVVNQSADKTLSSGLWTCEPGQFDWTYTWDEFVHILEGEVIITEEGGQSYTVGPGDMAHFPIGLKAHWQVIKTVRKFFVLKTPEPLEL
jgi:uncharacterized cupin superfamily protein